jgi:hypothetical protein
MFHRESCAFQIQKIRKWVFATAFLTVLCAATDLYAGGAVAKRQQMKKSRQQQPGQVQMQQQLQIQQMTIEREAQQETLRAQKQKQQAEETPQEIADIEDVMASLEKSSQAWPLIIDEEAKEVLVWKFMEKFRNQRVTIKNPPSFYAASIDEMIQQSPEMLKQPFPTVLQVVAIVEYDFDNGQDKEALALSVLGSKQAVAANKQRLGLR